MSLMSVETKNNITTVTLKRAEIHNAFNDELISELTKSFEEIAKSDARLVILTGEGKSFCAGADLNWMSSMVDYSMEENKADSLKLATLFQTINDCPIPVIGKVNGHALGGGVGLVSVCDYVHTHEKAKFGFTEVKLGLVPAVISPYCIAKIGESNARAWFLSGDLFPANTAKEMGLVHKVSSLESFEAEFAETLNKFLLAGPKAARNAKLLIRNVLEKNKSELMDYTCSEIAKIRISEEGQDGMKALLNKTKASWVSEE